MKVCATTHENHSNKLIRKKALVVFYWTCLDEFKTGVFRFSENLNGMKRVYNCQVWLLEHISPFTSHPQRPHHRPCSDCVIMFRLERLNGPISVCWKSTSGSCTIGLSYISLLLRNIFSWVRVVQHLYKCQCYSTYQTFRVWGTIMVWITSTITVFG